jgi:hypothetical protein
MNPRSEIARLFAEKKNDVNPPMLNYFWRAWGEDLISAGVPAEEVVVSMLSTAEALGGRILGAEAMVDRLRGAADVFEKLLDRGVDYPGRGH